MKLFPTFQADTAARLAADPLFTHVHIIIEDTRTADGSALYEEAVSMATQGQVPANGKVGLCIIVFTPEGKPVSVQNLGVEWGLELAVRVIENKALNDGADGAGIAAEEVLENAMLLLQRWAPIPGKVCTIGEFYKVPLKDEPELRAFEFTLNGRDAGKGLERVAVPTVTPSGPIITLACATSGAAIRFTLDGTLPTPTNGTLYSVPFDSDNATVRAIATKAGMAASDAAYFAG